MIRRRHSHNPVVIAIAAPPNQSGLSKGQKAFNKLIKEIEAKRAVIAEWDIVLPTLQRKYMAELAPLLATVTDLKVKVIDALDDAHGKKGLTNADRHVLADVIANLTQDVLCERDEDSLKAIYKKYAMSDYDKEVAEEFAELKFAVENIFGIEIDDDLDVSSAEKVMQHVHEKLAEQADANEEPQKPRKKSAKQLAKEAAQDAEAKQASLSMREVYRKLASALHPDRESDPMERERKTALMQRANQAYEKNNLLQ